MHFGWEDGDYLQNNINFKRQWCLPQRIVLSCVVVFQTVWWCYSGWQEPKDRTPIPYTVIVQARYGCNLANNIDKNLFSIWMLSWSESWRDSPGHYDAWESTHTYYFCQVEKSNRRELFPEKRTVNSVYNTIQSRMPQFMADDISYALIWNASNTL